MRTNALIILLSSLTLIARANEIVYTLSGYGQLVTSSTLRWVSTNSNEPYARINSNVVRGGKANGDSSSAICRGFFQNTLVPGGTNPLNQCAAFFFEKLVLLDDFQVLVDPTLTSRHEWQAWTIFTKVPVGAVAFTEGVAEATFIARLDSGKICELDTRRGLSGNLAVAAKDNNVAFVEKGYVLVELEPVAYELANVRYYTWRAKVDRTPVHLGHVLLKNDNKDHVVGENVNNAWDFVSSVLAFDASYSFYFGQLEGLIRALPAKAETYGHGGEKYENVDFSWGLPLRFTRHRIQEVNATLLSGTAVNVSLEAFLTTSELPYEATLVSHFKDGSRTEHNITGTYQETLLASIVVNKGVPFFIGNGTEAPTTTTTTTTPAPTTTPLKELTTEDESTLRPLRTTTPMPTEENPLLRFYPKSDEENEIPDDGIMLADQSLNKHSQRSPPMKEFYAESASAGSQTSAVALISCFPAIFLLLHVRHLG